MRRSERPAAVHAVQHGIKRVRVGQHHLPRESRDLLRATGSKNHVEKLIQPFLSPAVPYPWCDVGHGCGGLSERVSSLALRQQQAEE